MESGKWSELTTCWVFGRLRTSEPLAGPCAVRRAISCSPWTDGSPSPGWEAARADEIASLPVVAFRRRGTDGWLWDETREGKDCEVHIEVER